MRPALRCAIALLTATTAACRDLMTEPALPANAVAIAPMPQYALWWRLVERCAAVSGDMNAVSWYVVPGATDLGDKDTQGIYYPVSRRILLAERFARSGPLVRHEMLHALAPLGLHPAEYFQRRCGGVVACNDACIRDGGALAPVDSAGPLLRVAELSVSARADSTAPSLARDSGWTALTIEVRNSRAYAVRLRLTRLYPGYFVSGTYGYRASYCDGGRSNDPNYLFRADSTLVLGPGERQRHVFDILVGNACTIITPFFNDDTLSAIRIQPTG